MKPSGFIALAIFGLFCVYSGLLGFFQALAYPWRWHVLASPLVGTGTICLILLLYVVTTDARGRLHRYRWPMGPLALMAPLYMWHSDLVSATRLVYCLLVSPVVAFFCGSCLVLLLLAGGLLGKGKSPPPPRREWHQVPEISRLVAILQAYNKTPAGSPPEGISPEEEDHYGDALWPRKRLDPNDPDPDVATCVTLPGDAERPDRRLVTLVAGIQSDTAHPLHSQIRQMPNHLLHMIASVVATQRSTVLRCLQHASELEEQRYKATRRRMRRDMGSNIGQWDTTEGAIGAQALDGQQLEQSEQQSIYAWFSEEVKQRARLSATGGCLGGAVLLESTACAVLCQHADDLWGGTEADMKAPLTVPALQQLVGIEAATRLVDHFQPAAGLTQIVLRRSKPQSLCIGFHLDVARRTMHVPLNRLDCNAGGQLVFATETGLVWPGRRVGAAITHDHTMVHGVTRHQRTVRYGLFFVEYSASGSDG